VAGVPATPSVENPAPTRKSVESATAPVAPAPPASEAAPSSAAPSREVASLPTAPAPLDSRALAARGLEKELQGDHDGALADLRAALVIEPDPERQLGIRNLIQLLDTRR
jgi:hypothetical protein